MSTLQNSRSKRDASYKRTQNRFHRDLALSLESLENRQLLTAAPEIIIADDASALIAAAEAPGFRAVMVQPSGKIVGAGSFKGSQGDDFALVRYSADGSQLDASFGDNGVTLSNFSSSGKPNTRHDTLWGAGMDSQGRIVVSGHDNRDNLVIARYTINGNLDNTFSSDGFDIPGANVQLDESMHTIAFDSDDNVFIAGSFGGDYLSEMRVIKYAEGGSLDASFGAGGVVTHRPLDGFVDSGAAPTNRPVSVIVGADSSIHAGKVLLVGTAVVLSPGNRLATVVRLNSDGTLDSTFSNDGIVTTNIPFEGDSFHNNYGTGITIDASDRILISGISTHGLNVIRYDPDGDLDTTFNATGDKSDMPGVAVINAPSEVPPESITRGRDLVVDALGRIVVGGTYEQNPSSTVKGPGDNDAFVVARLNDNGTLDSTFGNDGSGVVETLVGSGWNELTDVAIAPNGDIWASGHACSSNGGCSSYGNGESFDSVLLRFAVPQASNTSPIANAGGPYIGDENESITFDASASSDADGDALTHSWDFGDGNTATTTAPTTQYAYEYGGNFIVTLTVDDGRGGSGEMTTTVTVAEINDAPVADPGGAYTGEPGNAVTFDASASTDFDNLDGTAANDQTLQYTWDFGDGTAPIITDSSTVDHAYAAVGSYAVTLTVSDGVTTDVSSTNASINDPPTATDIYVSSITFGSKRGGRDWRAIVEIFADSDGNRQASAGDGVAAGVSISVTFAGQIFSGTTDSNGIFRTGWIRKLASGTHHANVTDLALEGFVWDPLLLDLEDDTDGDTKPDGSLTI
jgi:uncharacterized delta-60 repeat protein